MNADERRLKTHNLSAFISVYQRPICLFQQPASLEGFSRVLPGRKSEETPDSVFLNRKLLISKGQSTGVRAAPERETSVAQCGRRGNCYGGGNSRGGIG